MVRDNPDPPASGPTSLAVGEAALAAFRPLHPAEVRTAQGDVGQWLQVLACRGVLDENLTAYSTLNLHEVPNPVEEGDRRIELMMLGPSDEAGILDALADAGLHVAAAGRAHSRPGRIYADLMAAHVPSTTTPHAWLTFPHGFPQLSSVSVGSEVDVDWLLLMPLTQAELRYSQQVGGDELNALLTASQVEFWDPWRQSLV